MERLTWRKASRSSANGGACVEVARAGSQNIAARDSKSPRGPVLHLKQAEFARLLAEVKSGKFDL
jgi:Domain of unknown function (DUF397)